MSWLDPCKVRRVTAVGSRKMAVYDDLATDDRIRVLDKGVCLPADGGDLTQPPMSYRYGDISYRSSRPTSRSPCRTGTSSSASRTVPGP